MTSTLSSPRPALSVIIPVHNGEGWIGRCIDHVSAAVRRATPSAVEIVLVDDGSTDGTIGEATPAAEAGGIPLVVISQPNSGRFAARLAGLRVATYDIVLFIDTRVFLGEESLDYVLAFVDDPATSVWTAHVDANTDLSPIAGFWQAIEHVAWRRYFKAPRRMSFGLSDFDYYPKGTTALLGPRTVMTEAFEQYRPTVDDMHISNDDTAVLRWVAASYPINISPEYNCVYNSRTTLRAFMGHARHRGAVLIDGYLRPGARFSIAIGAVLAVSPFAALSALRFPKVVLPGAAVASAGAAAAVRIGGARTSDSVVVGALAVPFGVNYLFGMWNGFAARLRSLGRRGHVSGASCGC